MAENPKIESKIEKIETTFEVLTASGSAIYFGAPDYSPVHRLRFDRSKWVQMGQPQYLKVTVQPCDIMGAVTNEN